MSKQLTCCLVRSLPFLEWKLQKGIICSKLTGYNALRRTGCRSCLNGCRWCISEDWRQEQYRKWPSGRFRPQAKSIVETSTSELARPRTWPSSSQDSLHRQQATSIVLFMNHGWPDSPPSSVLEHHTIDSTTEPSRTQLLPISSLSSPAHCTCLMR